MGLSKMKAIFSILMLPILMMRLNGLLFLKILSSILIVVMLTLFLKRGLILIRKVLGL